VTKSRGVREKRCEEATGAFIGTQASGIDNENEHDLKTPAALRLSLMGVWMRIGDSFRSPIVLVLVLVVVIEL
jgi:hypothetical protein